MSKAQFSMEYLMVTTFGIIVVISIGSYIFFEYYNQSEAVDQAVLDKFIDDIFDNAKEVYRQGPPARSEVPGVLPRGVLAATFRADSDEGIYELIVVVKSDNAQGNKTLFYPSDVPINGSFQHSDAQVGAKKAYLEAYRSTDPDLYPDEYFVWYNLGGRCPRSNEYDFNGNGGIDNGDAISLCQCYNQAPQSDGTYASYQRPTQNWEPNWFTGVIKCFYADYSGDCRIDDKDVELMSQKLGSPVSC